MYINNASTNRKKTRLHSSRMRTASWLAVSWEGGLPWCPQRADTLRWQNSSKGRLLSEGPPPPQKADSPLVMWPVMHAGKRQSALPPCEHIIFCGVTIDNKHFAYVNENIKQMQGLPSSIIASRETTTIVLRKEFFLQIIPLIILQLHAYFLNSLIC